MSKKAGVFFIWLSFIYQSCCLFIKEEPLGNNFFLSAYDNVDIRILYSQERCSGSGIEIVPMKVLEYAYNPNWIIAKSSGSGRLTNAQYYIIDKNFKVNIIKDNDSTLNIIRSHVLGPMDSTAFLHKLRTKKIDLALKMVK